MHHRPLVMVWAISPVEVATGFTSRHESSGGLTKMLDKPTPVAAARVDLRNEEPEYFVELLGHSMVPR